jgi:hypothetical protein
MDSNKIDFTEEKKKYEAFEESIELSFKKCKHKNVTYVAGELRCTCGASWSGPQLDELYKLFTKQK